MKKKVYVVTGSRAEFGLLVPVIRELYKDDHFDTKLVVTGAHLGESSDTEADIRENGFDEYISIKIDTECRTSKDMAVATGKAIVRYAELLDEDKPDIIVLLGDRYEVFAFATAAAIMGIPIAHLSGGDTTEGAVDEFLRHSVTKMSNLHFCTNEKSKERVIQMGEDPQFVHNVGSTSVENILNMEEIELSVIEEELQFRFMECDFAVVTFHPVTTEIDMTEEQLYELIRAMEAYEGMKFIITKSNSDTGGVLINETWEREEKTHENWRVVNSLGTKRYLSILRHAKMIIGNSSSGLSEAAILGIPAVNIGNRQKGRLKPDNVISCKCSKDDIVNAIETSLTESFREACKATEPPFGKGDTSIRIVALLKEYLSTNPSRIKSFYDMKNYQGGK